MPIFSQLVGWSFQLNSQIESVLFKAFYMALADARRQLVGGIFLRIRVDTKLAPFPYPWPMSRLAPALTGRVSPGIFQVR